MTTFKADEVEKSIAVLPTADVITQKIGVNPESYFKFPESLIPVYHDSISIQNSSVGVFVLLTTLTILWS